MHYNFFVSKELRGGLWTFSTISALCEPRARGRMGKLESFQWLSPIEFSFGEMEDYLYQVAQNHSDLVKVSVEGLTEEGRPIYLLKIGGREADGDNEAPLTSASTATIFIDAGRRLQLLLHLNPFFYNSNYYAMY